MDTLSHIFYSISALSTFVAVFIAYYLYAEFYKKVKQAQRFLLYKKELLQLNKYFRGETKCTSRKKLQGKNKNFYNIYEQKKYFECVLWETKTSLIIYKNETFDNVNQYISSIITDIDNQLNILFGIIPPRMPFCEIVDDILSRNINK